jgi:hypothetical protein
MGGGGVSLFVFFLVSPPGVLGRVGPNRGRFSSSHDLPPRPDEYHADAIRVVPISLVHYVKWSGNKKASMVQPMLARGCAVAYLRLATPVRTK